MIRSVTAVRRRRCNRSQARRSPQPAPASECPSWRCSSLPSRWWVQHSLGDPASARGRTRNTFPQGQAGLLTVLKCHHRHRFSRRELWRRYRNLIKSEAPGAIDWWSPGNLRRRPGQAKRRSGTHNHREEFGDDSWLPISPHNISLGLLIPAPRAQLRTRRG